MGKHTINPVLAIFANKLYTKFLYPITEYQKENLTNSSYIFAPNHTNNLDGYIIWSLLAKDYDIDTFMYKEFWETKPLIAKFLPYINVYPITRDKVKLNEILTELKKLKDPNHSLIIFPQGRHVDPEVMVTFKKHHLRTIPLGAFFVATKAKKELVPIYMEPQKLKENNLVIYGTPLNPQDFIAKNSKEGLIVFASAWLNEINKLYKLSKEIKGETHRYVIQERYTDATGRDYGLLKDPNRIINYKDTIEYLAKIAESTGITDIHELSNLIDIDSEATEVISEINDMYEKRLIKH